MSCHLITLICPYLCPCCLSSGFTILLPYLVHAKKFWHNTKLRILTVPAEANNPQKAARQMAVLQKLVAEFRIPASVHVEAPDEPEDGELERFLEESPLGFSEGDRERVRRNTCVMCV